MKSFFKAALNLLLYVKQFVETVNDPLNTKMNWTALISTIMRMQQTTENWLSRLMMNQSLPSLPEFMNYNGTMEDYFKRLEAATQMPIASDVDTLKW